VGAARANITPTLIELTITPIPEADVQTALTPLELHYAPLRLPAQQRSEFFAEVVLGRRRALGRREAVALCVLYAVFGAALTAAVWR
jgi:hypothetical protein